MSETEQNFAAAMKREWNTRAIEDAKWYINTLRVQQSEQEFDQTGRVETERLVLADLNLLTQWRDPKQLRVLEIGCGAGRMTKHLAGVFGEVVGVDVSGEMIRQAAMRLAGLANVQLHETSGVDFPFSPQEHFDLILSAYVFQHVPSAEVIGANISDGWRVLKPGGVFKFQTNGVESQTVARDTWTGAAFPEARIRDFARTNSAQLISIFGADTQYCWATMRKRGADESPTASARMQPQIEFYGRTVAALNKIIPTAGDQSSLTIIASGIGRNRADCNNTLIKIADAEIAARYVGPIGQNFEAALQPDFAGRLDALTQIEIGMPPNSMGGKWPVSIEANGNLSDLLLIEFQNAPAAFIRIGTIMNAYDQGLDIYSRGEKSRLKILVEGLPQSFTEEHIVVADSERSADALPPLSVTIDGRPVKPDHIGFLPSNGLHEINLQLPSGTQPGEYELSIVLGSLGSFGDWPTATAKIEVR